MFLIQERTWTKADDAYYFILHQEVDGIPISQIAYGDGYEGTGIEMTELKAVYGAKGWMELQQYWGYVLERTGENWEILSIKDAVNSLQKKCSMLVTDGKWKIEKIELELIPVFIKDNDYEIRPVWTFIGGELIAAFTGSAYCDERESGYYVYWIQRCSVKNYVISKMLNCYLGSLCILTSAMFVWICGLRLFLPWVNKGSDMVCTVVNYDRTCVVSVLYLEKKGCGGMFDWYFAYVAKSGRST